MKMNAFENKEGLSQISQDALMYGLALEIDDKKVLASKLYFYNRLPLTPKITKKFPSSKSILEYLFMDEFGNNHMILQRKWRQQNIKGDFGNTWMSFISTKESQRLVNQINYKLYLSTDIQSLRQILEGVLNVLQDSNAFYLKFGKQITEYLRPDGFIIYFKNKSDLMDTAYNLKPIVDRAMPRGVPFTAEIYKNGLMSWGMDPPARTKDSFLQKKESWRSWICNQIASAIIDTRKVGNDMNLEPWKAVTKKLRENGIDTARWTISENVWSKYE